MDLDLLRSDVAGWNARRGEDDAPVDLDGADLRGLDLRDADLRDASLRQADLRGADLRGADLRRANFRGTLLSGARLEDAQLYRANFNRADLTGASLVGADLSRCYLGRTVLRDVDASDANLQRATLVQVDLDGARLDGAHVHGLSVWDVAGEISSQSDLVITPDDEPVVTVDNLRMAQFVHLLISNSEVRDVVDTITSKVVLILGRFTAERKPVLDAIRAQLRTMNRTPIMFDFSKPAGRGYGETVALLARMARYVVVDLTDAAEVRSELMQFVPTMPRLPVLPLLLAGEIPYATFATDIAPYPWVLDTFVYDSGDHLIAALAAAVAPADEMWSQLAGH